MPTFYEGIQMPKDANCPFCHKRDAEIRYQNAVGFAFLDSLPAAGKTSLPLLCLFILT